MSRWAAFVVASSVTVAGCRTESPSDAFERMEKVAEPFYNGYWTGSPEGSLAAIQNVERLAGAASQKAWAFMDRDTYMALVDARVCLAFERLGNTNDATPYRRMAVHHFQCRKTFNSEYQAMLPVTPSPSAKDAEKELFFMVGKLDERARRKRTE